MVSRRLEDKNDRCTIHAIHVQKKCRVTRVPEPPTVAVACPNARKAVPFPSSYNGHFKTAANQTLKEYISIQSEETLYLVV